jgi:hypothetical protein
VGLWWCGWCGGVGGVMWVVLCGGAVRCGVGGVGF